MGSVNWEDRWFVHFQTNLKGVWNIWKLTNISVPIWFPIFNCSTSTQDDDITIIKRNFEPFSFSLSSSLSSLRFPFLHYLLVFLQNPHWYFYWCYCKFKMKKDTQSRAQLFSRTLPSGLAAVEKNRFKKICSWNVNHFPMGVLVLEKFLNNSWVFRLQ